MQTTKAVQNTWDLSAYVHTIHNDVSIYTTHISVLKLCISRNTQPCILEYNTKSCVFLEILNLNIEM